MSGQMSARYGVEMDFFRDFKNLMEFIIAEDRSATMKAMTEAVKNCTPWSLTYRVRLPSGELRWNLNQATLKREPDGSKRKPVPCSAS